MIGPNVDKRQIGKLIECSVDDIFCGEGKPQEIEYNL